MSKHSFLSPSGEEALCEAVAIIVDVMFFQDQEKAKLWTKTASPLFGGIPPCEMIGLGKFFRLLKVIITSLEENEPINITMTDHNHESKEECHDCKLKREAFNEGVELAAKYTAESGNPARAEAIRRLKRNV